MSPDGTADLITHPFETPPETGEAIEVADGILWMRLPLPMKLDHVNVYALDDGDGWTVIDTGFDSRKSREIWNSLLSGPLAGKPVHRTIATHHHPDHIGLSGWLQTDHGAELLTTRTAWIYTRMLTLDTHDVPSDEHIAFMQAAGLPEDRLTAYRETRPFNFSDMVAPLPLGYTRIQEGDEIEIGGRRWRIHCGDGHAPEHAMFWEIDGPLVIAGDQILPGISPHLGVFPSEPDADPVIEWLQSCTRFRDLATSAHFVLPGHKLPFFGLRPRLQQLLENHESALDRLCDHLQTPDTAPGCFLTLFKRNIGDGEFGLALSETLAHLNNLRRTKRIERHTNANGVWEWTSIPRPS